MKRFAYRAIREVLFGVAAGGLAALGVRSAVILSAGIWCFLQDHLSLTTVKAIVGDRNFEILVCLIAVCLVLLSAPGIGSFISRLFRSWSAGVFTGIALVWFLLTLVFFVSQQPWTAQRSLTFIAIGVLFVVASRLVVIVERRDSGTLPISIPVPTPSEPVAEPEFKFDMPILAWSEDRLKRGDLIRGMADQIIRDKAPVLAIVGPFGEGKTSALNLLAASLAGRADVILVRFSSWLPGDPQTLAFSLFATISKQIKSRYLIFGLSNRLRKFARLLAGSIPRLGENLRQLFEPPSQMEQLDSLRELLNELPARVVVLVDEMDRLDRAELFVLLKAIRGVVDFPNISYVCAFDRRALARLISRKDLAYGEYYLEKFFPMRIGLPAVDQLLLGNFFDQELERICKRWGLLLEEKEKNSFNEAARELWHDSIKHILTNFRKMTLFFDALRTALAPVYAEVNLFDMVVLQLVRLVSEDTYDFIYANGPVFYYPNWRIDLWTERLSVDDGQEAAIRKKRINALFETLPMPVKDRVTVLLRKIFPAVKEALHDSRYSQSTPSEELADQQRRIYHPEYFPRYFIHQVPANLFGKLEMSAFIDDLNSGDNLEGAIEKFRQIIERLANYWRRLSFLEALVQDSRRLGDVQAEALVIAVPRISDSLDNDVLGLGAWGRARALVLVNANRFSGTVKLQQLLETAINESVADDFAADILRFSTKMRAQNKIITNWLHVDEQALMETFAARMARRYAVNDGREPPYDRRDAINSFLIWAGISHEARAQEIEFFRSRFQSHPLEPGRFIGWLLPKHGVAYSDDPLLIVEKLFPLYKLVDLVEQFDAGLLTEGDRESVHWFIELIEKRKAPKALDDDPVV